MKIKRFFAQDVRQAIRMVRDELGSDAVILSNRNIDGGVEIVAARDFDEQLIVQGNSSAAAQEISDGKPARTDGALLPEKRRELNARRSSVGKQDTGPVSRHRGQAGVQIESPQDPANRFDSRKREGAAVSSPNAQDIAPRQCRSKPSGKSFPREKRQTVAVSPPRENEARPREVIRKLNTGSFVQWKPDSGAVSTALPRDLRQPESRREPENGRVNQQEEKTVNGVQSNALGDTSSIGNQRPGAERAAAVMPESTEEPLLLEMFREIKRMREVLDGRSTQVEFNRVTHTGTACLDLIRRLTDMGFSQSISAEAVKRLESSDDSPDMLLRQTLDIIASDIPIAEDNPLTDGGAVALVGPTGVGKTTTIAKLAADFLIRHGRDSLALVTIDNYRIGAHEQLKTYGRLLDVPVRTAANADDLERILQNFRNKRLVLIDTPGMGQRDVRLADQLSMLRDDRFMIQSCLVISAITQAKALQEMLKAFGVFHLSACILTKLDEAVTYGALVSALIEHPLPLAFTCDGQRVPEDLHRADARKLIALCAGEEGRQDGPMNVYSNPRKMSHSYA